MTSQELLQLSKPQLVQIILQQQAAILQQQKLIAKLEARLAELEALVKRLTQPPKDASNSSTAPSQTRQPNRPADAASARRSRNGNMGPSPAMRGAAAGGKRLMSSSSAAPPLATIAAALCSSPEAGSWGPARSSSCRRFARWSSRPGAIRPPARIAAASKPDNTRRSWNPSASSASVSKPSSATYTTSSTSHMSVWRACWTLFSDWP
jgi:hypothetical protein